MHFFKLYFLPALFALDFVMIVVFLTLSTRVASYADTVRATVTVLPPARGFVLSQNTFSEIPQPSPPFSGGGGGSLPSTPTPIAPIAPSSAPVPPSSVQVPFVPVAPQVITKSPPPLVTTVKKSPQKPAPLRKTPPKVIKTPPPSIIKPLAKRVVAVVVPVAKSTGSAARKVATTFNAVVHTVTQSFMRLFSR